MSIPESPAFAAKNRDPIAEAEALQRAYRERRRRWAWRHGKPYSEDLEKPLPAVFDGDDPENG